jgi:cellulose synthase/poly-beta-1,6-N-acetylglucosamine synthase-like glycosyltransferase
MSFWESLVLPRYYKWDVVKTRQASHGLTETRQKGHWKMMLSRRGKRKIHTLEIGGHVQMTKSDPEAQRKPSSSDCTWLESEYGSFNLEALKFLMHFREPESSLYFYFYTYSFFLFFSYISFFLFLIFFFFFLIKILFAPLWTLKLHRTYLLPHA